MDHPIKKQIDGVIADYLGNYVMTGLEELVRLACPECGYLKIHTVDCSRRGEDE